MDPKTRNEQDQRANASDQVVLVKLATTHSDPVVRGFAVERITDQAALAKVATTDSDYKVRKTAVENLEDHGVLADIAKNDSNDSV